MGAVGRRAFALGKRTFGAGPLGQKPLNTLCLSIIRPSLVASTTSSVMLSYVVKPALLDGHLHLWMDYPDFGMLDQCSLMMLDEPWSRPTDIHQLLNLHTIQYA